MPSGSNLSDADQTNTTAEAAHEKRNKDTDNFLCHGRANRLKHP
jgi:hypothetical protein